MPVRYDIFECDGVQDETRRKARGLGAVALAALVLAANLVVFYQRGFLSAPLLGGCLLLVVSGTIIGVVVYLRKLQRVVWCLKVSESDLIGYDFTRRRRALDWNDVYRVEVDDDGLRLVGAHQRCLFVPSAFENFPALSHRVAAFAEARGTPVYVDGRPWQDLDVYRLFPFLAEDPSADASV